MDSSKIPNLTNKVALSLINKWTTLPFMIKSGVILLSSWYLLKKFILNNDDNNNITKEQIKYEHYIVKRRPKRIILLCNGAAQTNVNESSYASLPNHLIELNETGVEQAIKAGTALKSVIEDESVRFYVSPLKRTKDTFSYLIQSFKNENQYNYQEDPRLRGQEKGNVYREEANKKFIKKEKELVGKFFYRYLNGVIESGADVYDRCTMFLDTLMRRIDNIQKKKYDNYVIVTHGLFMQLFIMRYFKLSVEQFEKLKNPKHCELWVLLKNEQGYYELQSSN